MPTKTTLRRAADLERELEQEEQAEAQHDRITGPRLMALPNADTYWSAAHSFMLRNPQECDSTGAKALDMAIDEAKSDDELLSQTPPALRAILERERAAEEQLAEVKSERTAVLSTIDQWNNLVDQFQCFGKRIENLSHLIGELESSVTKRRQTLRQQAGSPNMARYSPLQWCADILQVEAALPMLKDVLISVQADLGSHVERMKLFAKEHQVPGECWSSLSGPSSNGVRE